MDTPLTLKDIGEYGLHSRILDLLGNKDRSPFGPGDDACIIPISKELGIAISTDIVPEGLKGRYAGKMAVVSNYSDLLAVGATPKGILISVCAPRDHHLVDFDDLINGVQEEALKYNTSLLGGDTKERAEYCVDGTAIGTLKLGNIITRSGARAGDIIAVTRSCNIGWGRRWAFNVCLEQLGSYGTLTKILSNFYESDLIIPYKEMIALAESKTVNAGLDCSDGLSASLHLLSNSSNVGVVIDARSLIGMLAEETIQAAIELSIPPETFCFTPGFDWECLVAIKKDLFDQALSVTRRSGGGLVRIGEVTDGNEITFRNKSKKLALPPVADMKFTETNQYNTPKEWLKFARSFKRQ